jgi:hypothetical protein
MRQLKSRQMRTDSRRLACFPSLTVCVLLCACLSRISTLSKENAQLQSGFSESQQLLDRLREDLNSFKDIRALREKYAEL